MTSNLDDQTLIGLYLGGDQDAFRVITQRYSSAVRNMAYSVVHDAVYSDDITQDTFFRMTISLRSGKYKEHGELKSWLMRVAHNTSIDYIRRRNRMPIDYFVYDDEENSPELNISRYDDESILNPEEIMIISEEGGNFDISKDELFCMIDKLSVNLKEVVMLRFFHNFTFQEIAAYTGVSINTALGRMRYALINLRNQIADNYRENNPLAGQ